MDYKKKSNLAIVLIAALTVVLAIMLGVLLTGCAAAEQTDSNRTGDSSRTGDSNGTGDSSRTEDSSGTGDSITNTAVSGNEEVSTVPDAAVVTPGVPDENKTEDLSGLPEDDAVISRYYGDIDTVDGLVIYDITTKQLGEYQYVMDLQFYDYGSKEKLQQFSYNLRDDFMPDTVRDGFQTADVNNDGNEDMILDLGIYGHLKLALCYVYDPGRKGYVQLAGFDELMTPQYISSYGLIFEEWRGDAAEYGINKYRVDGNELVLVASLYAKYGGSPSPVYTEKVLIDGEMVTTKEKVPAEEIDAGEWNNSLP